MAAGLAIPHGRTGDLGLVGRDAEVAEIGAFLTATAGAPSALVIVGDVGIGKTAVWKHAVQAAAGTYRVLSGRPACAEAPLAFSALDDLFGGVLGEILPGLPEPRRRALEAALHGSPGEPVTISQDDTSSQARTQGEPAAQGATASQPGIGGESVDRGGPAGSAGAGRPQPEPRLLARAVLDGLRILSRDTPVLLAVDDAQWLDRPSAQVLEFCIRRLDQQAAVSILLTLRGEDPVFPLGLEQALPPACLACAQLGGLSPGAIGAILRARLGVTFPRSTFRRLYEACGGNPLYALESGRALLERGRACAAGEPIPIPAGISDLVRPRLSGLSPGALRVGRLIAASADPREHVIRAAHGGQAGGAAMDEVIDDGLIRRDRDALRFTHPLLGPVLYAGMTAGERRDVHRRLARSAVDVEERAWHLALGADGPSGEIAGLLDAAARHAATRGVPETAAVLAEQAMRMTPSRPSPDGPARILRAADYHFRAGEIGRSRELVESALTGCPAGPRRAALLIRQATISYHQSGWAQAEPLLHQAALEAAADTELRAHAEGELAEARMAAGDLPAASHRAAEALGSAEQAGRPRLLAHSLARLAAVEFLLGNPVRADLLTLAERAGAGAGDEPVEYLALTGPSFVRGAILKWSDRLDEARRCFAGCYRRTLDRGDDASLPHLLAHLSELECWAGNWDAAAEYAREGCAVASESHQQAMLSAPMSSLALVRAHQGKVDEARGLAAEALALADRSGNIPLMSSVLAVLGFVATSLGDHPAARAHLDRLARLAPGAGLDQPSVVKFLPDEIEALAALGEIGLAEARLDRLQARGQALRRPWALAAAARCRAHLAGMAGDHDAARAACAQALAEHERLPMPFELGRTLLTKGITERRARRKSAAGESFGQALAIFERLGAPLWAAKARRELSATAARPIAGGLTQTQHRVATLIAQGQTNREIAAAMFITVNTVQTHIRHIFQKLGVRSRTELAAVLLATPARTGAFQGARNRDANPGRPAGRRA
jgi:DNA-binding CsgD family transcriptional regulator/tetratricopeptide (TPR) repeat protein